ncbi:MAG: MATE family efflux transporter, partial [Peptococcaceae bacterium]|nr:MATE family efflux transporter [Peptococcaceae bacterium]
STIALATNTFLNYVLIFGHFGAPALGVKGAALATLFARILEAAIILIYVYGKHTPLAVKPSDFDFHPAFLLQDWRTVLPVMLNELCWGLATIVYTAAYGRIDTDALASIQIANTVQNLFLIFGMGVSGATATMVGNTIGRGLTKRAETYAYRSILLCMVIGVLLTVVIIISAPLFIWFYHLDSAQVANDALLMIRILALSMPVKLVNITVIMGVLRAGGDVVFSLLFESCTMWFIGVPLAFIGALALKWPVYLVYALVIVEEVIKFVLCLWRSFSGKWMKILV